MLSTSALQDASVNEWFRCALLLTGRVLLPGMAWAWVVPGFQGSDQPRWMRWLSAAARSLLVGMTLALLSTLALAEAGACSVPAEWLATAILAVAGVVAGAALGKVKWGEYLRRHGPVFAGFPVAVAVLMLLPSRGEWILGGWDPGLYVNQGVAASRTGGFREGPDAAFSLFTENELALVTRPYFNYTEAFPGVRVDPASRALEPAFFHLMPAFVAVLHRCGGLRAAVRVNEFAGLITLVLFLAFAASAAPKRAWALFAAFGLLVQPVWLYHLHVPVSEMLQMLLLCGMALVTPVRWRGRGTPVLLAVLMFLAVVNRFSFLPFGGLLLGVLSWLDLEEPDRARVSHARAGQVAALAAGAIYDYLCNPTAMGRLAAAVPHSAVPKLLAVFLILAAFAVLADYLATVELTRQTFRRLADRWAFPAGLIGLLALGGAAFARRWPSLDWCRANIEQMIPYEGAGLLLAALGGAAVLAASREDGSRLAKGWALFLLGGTAAALMNPDIAALLPWATRRYVEFTVPLVALLVGILCGALWGLRAGAARWAAVVLAAALALSNARGGRRAWAFTEFNGASAVLSDIAAGIGPSDLVIADHFRWATPLRFIYGKPVINGEVLFAEGRARRVQDALAVFGRLRAQGRRIRFLTSTEDGLSVFPAPIAPVTRDWVSEPYTFFEIAHHPEATGFTLREKTKVFTLFTWQSEP